MNRLQKFAKMAIITLLISITYISCNNIETKNILGESTSIEKLQIKPDVLRSLEVDFADNFKTYLSSLDITDLPFENKHKNIEVRKILKIPQQKGFSCSLALLFSKNKFLGQLIYINRTEDGYSTSMLADWSKVEDGNGYVINSFMEEGYVSTLKLERQGSVIYYNISDVANVEKPIPYAKGESLKDCTARVYKIAKEACDQDPGCKLRCDIADAFGGLCTTATFTAAAIACMRQN